MTQDRDELQGNVLKKQEESMPCALARARTLIQLGEFMSEYRGLAE
jgi:hypothetical protein